LSQADLTSANLYQAILSGANLRGTTLINANFDTARLTGADLTGANIRGASLAVGGLYGCCLSAGGITPAQLYSTASYQLGDLRGVNFTGNHLAGGNFTGQNLAGAQFNGATLTDADFTDADVRGANFIKSYYTWNPFYGTGITLDQLYSTASYQAHDLNGIVLSGYELSGANFAGQNLTSASFGGARLSGSNFCQANLTNASFNLATLTNADFTGAMVRGANFGRYPYASPPGTGITLAQLYSTADYQSGDLSGIGLDYNDLAGGNFSAQNLTNATLFGTLTGADFTGADTRGATLFAPDAITTNLISPEGQINGLVLGAGRLVVRDYDGDPRYDPARPPIPVTVDEHLTMAPGGALRMVLDADAWDSTISFAPGIPVTLGGTLELTFADDVNLASQLGRTFDLFDWTGVTPVGAFAVDSSYRWDLSHLYTTGEVTLAAVPEPAGVALLTFAPIAYVRGTPKVRRRAWRGC
jgi:uncharacterized protein YjbI with pentapeptide repeats